MPNPLTRKLECHVRLDDDDRHALAELMADARTYRAGEDLVQEGAKPECVFVLTEGWACKYKLLPNGQRQILAYMLPGDTCDVFNFVLDRMDYSIGALGACKAVQVPQSEIMDAVRRHPAIARAMYWTTLVDGSTLREWLLSIGQRDGFGRAAHLFSELLARMAAIGLADGDSFTLPVTQTDLADTMGLTPVYVNRMLQKLRREELITLDRRALTILDPAKLIALSAFNPAYLHLSSPGSLEKTET